MDSNAYFLSDGEGRFTATEATGGPWSDDLQHGGPPSALLVRAAERAAGATTTRQGDDGLVALRVAVDFLGPVPVGPVTVEARVTRPGRAIVGADAELVADGRTAMRARVWLLRLGTPTTAVGPESPCPASPEGVSETHLPWDFPYAASIEWRLNGGDPLHPGPAAVWARQTIPLIHGEEPSGLQRVVLVADSGSGVSAVLDWDRWSFVNIDLDVHLLRPAVGEWIHLDAVTRTSSVGSGLCSTTLHDTEGHLGGSAQTLVVQPR